MDLTDRIRTYLSEQNDAIAPTGSGFEKAMAVGDQIRRRRNAGWFSVSLVAVALVGFGMLNLRYEPQDENAATEVTTDVVPSSAAPDLQRAVVDVALSELDWQLFDLTTASLGTSAKVFSWDGRLYALATVPGLDRAADPDDAANQPAHAVLTSDNGIDWSVTPVDDDVWVGDVAHYQGTLYTVATAPGVQRRAAADYTSPVEAVVSYTPDAGSTWTATALPLVAAVPEGFGSVLYRESRARVAAGGPGALALVTTDYVIDYKTFVPAEYRTDEMGVQRTETGIEAIDYTAYMEAVRACENDQKAGGSDEGMPESCRIAYEGSPEGTIAYSATWEELGVLDPPQVSFSEMFLSDGGDTFEQVDSPFGNSRLTHLYGTEDGFVALDYAVAPSGVAEPPAEDLSWRIWMSADGRSWDVVDFDDASEMSWIQWIGSIGSKLVVVGTGAPQEFPEIVVLTSDDNGATWHDMDLSFLYTESVDRAWWVSDAQVGAEGVVLAIQSAIVTSDERIRYDTADYRLLLSSDLETWEQVELADFASNPEGFGLGLGPVVADANRVAVFMTVYGEYQIVGHQVLVGT